ncbi:long-chain fatty acid--CoA ligase [Nocardioides sp. HDW12B]|uniref:class I adenylate-forming enzyme family protein n=1 Tax=Nocardioides sp. HDW12B TaxID=2714939 RepID=UPI00140E031E|nr:AMP-binding protein [Nocardioides sp. HDW12B]QIK65127.1 long-chain fatty acid--CoA ligase [Nocardioides sp. HDW12B]
MTANLADLLAHTAAQRPDGVALIDAESGVRLTWQELEDTVARCATGLSAQGLVAGNRVAIAIGNRVELVVLHLAALRARLVSVPVNPRSATGELLRVVADSGARLLVADPTTVDPARAVVTGLREALPHEGRAGAPRLVVLDAPTAGDEIAYDALLAEPAAVLPPPRDAESLAVLLYTSGTSGRPRAAMLSHRALLANITQAGSIDPPLVQADDVVYGVLPLFHVYGLNAVLGQVLATGATLVVVDGFSVEQSLEHVRLHGVTVLPVAPPVLASWRAVGDLADRLAGVRTVMSGAAPMPEDLVTEYADRFGLRVHQGYGLTETAPVLTSTLCGTDPAKRGSVGRALPGVTLRVRDDAEGGERVRGGAPDDVPSGDPGVIEVRGDNLFSGYWPDGEGGPDAEGWWSTGDIGLLDADGDLFLVDRVTEIVIVSGFNVYPSEIEEVLTEVPQVQEAVVLGVPDVSTGEAVVAYLRLGPGQPTDPASLEEVVAAAHRHAAERLARFKRPARIEVVDSLPRTVTGKVARGRLRSQARGAPDVLG